jgi:hypothetical protein
VLIFTQGAPAAQTYTNQDIVDFLNYESGHAGPYNNNSTTGVTTYPQIVHTATLSGSIMTIVTKLDKFQFDYRSATVCTTDHEQITTLTFNTHDVDPVATDGTGLYQVADVTNTLWNVRITANPPKSLIRSSSQFVKATCGAVPPLPPVSPFPLFSSNQNIFLAFDSQDAGLRFLIMTQSAWKHV